MNSELPESDSRCTGSGKIPREMQKAHRNAQILGTALDLFIRRGYAGTRIQDIASAIGMSTGLLFHYFPSKEKLYEELVRVGLTGTKYAMNTDADDALEFFRQNARMILDLIKGSSFAAKIFVLMGQAGHNDAAPEAIRELVREVSIVADSVPLIERGQAQGTIREGNPLSLSCAFWGCVQGIAEELVLYPNIECPDPECIVDILRKKGA
jgi:TetR/AcrR family transcriptional regulator